MPRPADGKYVLRYVLPLPIGVLHFEVHVGPMGMTVPLVGGTLPYDPPTDLFGVPGGPIAIECGGDGSWHGSVNGLLVEGLCEALP